METINIDSENPKDVRLEYTIVARQKPPFNLKQNNLTIKDKRLHRVTSPKNGSTPDRALLHFFSFMDILTLPLGYVEWNCEFMLKHYYLSNGSEGWSEETVKDLLIRMKRNPQFVEKFITKIKQEYENKNLEVKTE